MPLALAVLPAAPAAPAPPPLRVTFIALDYGEATLIRAPGGMVGLMGAGAAADAPRLRAFLRKVGVSRLDVLVGTSWTERCLGGAPALLMSLPVRTVIRNPLYVKTPVGERFLAAVERQGLKENIPPPGNTETLFHSPPCQMRAVAPTGPMYTAFRSDPRCSAMYELQYDRASVFCMGEASQKHQQAMWAQARERPWGHVLQIGRSGGADSLLASILKPMRTRFAVIPVPRKLKERPAGATLTALRNARVTVFRTDQRGSVTATGDGTGFKVTAER